MTAIFDSVRHLVYQYRELIFVGVIGPALITFLSAKNRGRDDTTLAALGLQGRMIDDSFKTWAETTYGKANVEAALDNPERVVLKAQILNDLSRKMILPIIVIASSYITPHNTTLVAALQNLLSHSAKASKVALPVFQHIAASPVLSTLLDLRVIVCAPVALKALLIVLNYAGVETHFMDRVAKGLEMFSGLAFSLHSLGISTSLYHSIANASYLFAVYYLLPLDMLKEKIGMDLTSPLENIPTIISQTGYFQEQSYFWLSNVMNLICYVDYYPTRAFVWGLQAFMASFKASYNPYDEAKIFERFTTINQSRVTIDEFEQNLSKKQKEVDHDLKHDKISELLAAGLKNLIHEKNKSLLKEIAESITKEELSQIPGKFQRIIVVLESCSTKKLITDAQHAELKAVAKDALKTYYDNLKNNQVTSSEQRKMERSRLQEEISVYSRVISSLLDCKPSQLNSHFKHLPDVKFELRDTLSQAIKTAFMSRNAGQVRYLLKEFYTNLVKVTQEKLFSKQLEPVEPALLQRRIDEKFENFLLENEKYLTEIFGGDGIFNKLAGDDKLISNEYIYTLFNTNFNWYLKQSSRMHELQRRACEIKLITLAKAAIIDPQILAKSDAQSIAALKMKRAQSARALPDGFNFATYSLAYFVGQIRSQMDAPPDTLPLTQHLPYEHGANLREHMPIPENKELMERESNGQKTFPTSKEIREKSK